MNFSVAFFGNAVHPPGASPWGLRVQVQLLFPKISKQEEKMIMEQKLKQLATGATAEEVTERQRVAVSFWIVLFQSLEDSDNKFIHKLENACGVRRPSLQQSRR